MLKDLVNLFFPECCYACSYALSDNEYGICTSCRHDLPITSFHLEKDNSVSKIFYGRVKLEYATALLWFQKKGMVQQLLHNLKYRGHEKVGCILGEWLGYELQNSPFFNTIDAVIPVPLHKTKLRKRGYNQVAKFGQEIAKALEIEYIDNVLVKTTATKTQVFKTRFARWDASKAIFSVQNSHLISGKHILLVDDIITTGATIESCANALLSSNTDKNIKISVASMAIAQ